MIGWDFRKSPSNSQVASSGLKCFYCTYTWKMALLRSVISLRSIMRRGSTWNSPSGSTYTKFQSIIWVGSWTYFFNKETWNTLWIIRLAGSAIWYATSPIQASISKGPQNLGAILAQFPSFSEIFQALTFKYTWSPAWNSKCLLFRSA